MPKLKPGNIVARVILGESWRERNNTDYLYARFERYLSESHPQAHSRRASDDDDDDDGCSIFSSSTTSTADNIPGTGRTVDMHIFQPLGRWIERVAMRFTIASLHPAHIAQYIGADNSALYLSADDPKKTLHGAIADLCFCRDNGSTVVAGMKGLVKQTQSNSINKCASALAALIRVSFFNFRRVIYVNVSRIEPIFHLEELAGSLPCSHPEKKWFLLLVKLGRETLIVMSGSRIYELFDPVTGNEETQRWPSPEFSLNLRRRLIRALEVYRLSGLVSLDNTIGEACAICAEVASPYRDEFTGGDAYIHLLETVYFTVIFVLRSIHELADFATTTANRHIYMVLRTIACWIDAVMTECMYGLYVVGGYDIDLLKAEVAFRSLVILSDDIKHTILPESFDFHARTLRNLHKDILPALPRRHREATEWVEENPLIQSFIEAAKHRTRRLLRSFDELEREAWGASQTNISSSQLKMNADPQWFFLYSFDRSEYWKSTLERARKVHVSETILTEEFREARRYRVQISWGDWIWNGYQLNRVSRHKLGQYLCSNMDWDWDLGTCMRRLFKEGRSTAAQSSLITRSEIDVDAAQGTTWRLEAQGNLPKQVQIACKTESGETQYMSFVPMSSSMGGILSSMNPDAVPSVGDAGSMPQTDMQEGNGYRKGSIVGEYIKNNREGQVAPYDVGFNREEAAGGEDRISICSLD